MKFEGVDFLVHSLSRSNHFPDWKMTNMKMLIVMVFMTGLLPLAFAQNAAAPRVNPADSKDHIGETATVCGKVVDTKISKYGIAGHGKPVIFDIDQPEPSPVFYFLTFGTDAGGPQEAIGAYQGKRVCVTGKITIASSGAPFIMAADRAQIKIQTDAK
jgi:hypothetical protein